MLVRTEERQYVRDTNNHALLTTDQQALSRARAQRQTAQRSMSLEHEVDNLRGQVVELTTLVQQLLKTSHG
jgi:hypothetical protein